MASFAYQGYAGDGRAVNGTLEAPSERQAYDRLLGDGITPTELRTTVGKAGRDEGDAGWSARLGFRKPAASPGAGDVAGIDNASVVPLAHSVASGGGFSLGTGVKRAAITLFVRELATFLNAGVPLLEALGVLRKQESNARLRMVLDDVHGRVQGGESFSRALERHPHLFPPLLVTMARVGETGGMLGSVLDQMANWMEREDEVSGEVRGAMAYPAFVLALGVVSVAILTSVVLPRITPIFEGMQGRLPLPTRVLMGLSAFVMDWWWALALGGAALVGAWLRLRRTPGWAQLRDRAILRVPLFGDLALKSSIARFSRACGALLGAGVPLLEALRVVRGLIGNGVVAAAVGMAIEDVTRGQGISWTLGRSGLFPPTVVHLIGVGERTGRLDEMMLRVADMFERQTRQRLKVVLEILSPMLILGLAVMVALIAVAILLPIARMNQLMH